MLGKKYIYIKICLREHFMRFILVVVIVVSEQFEKNKIVYIEMRWCEKRSLNIRFL